MGAEAHGEPEALPAKKHLGGVQLVASHLLRVAVLRDRNVRMAHWRLFLKVSTCRLQRQTQSIEDGPRELVVLLLQVYRIHGHDLLRVEEEEQSRVYATRDSPRLHAHVSLVRCQVHTRWPLDLLRTAKHLCPHRDVHVLPVGGDGPQGAAVPLVEKVPDRLPDAAVRRHHDPRVPATVHRVQLPQGVRLVDRPARRHVPLPVQRVLPAELPAEEAEKVRGAGERRGEESRASPRQQARQRQRRRRQRLLAEEEGRRRLLREGRESDDGAEPAKAVRGQHGVTASDESITSRSSLDVAFGSLHGNCQRISGASSSSRLAVRLRSTTFTKISPRRRPIPVRGHPAKFNRILALLLSEVGLLLGRRRDVGLSSPAPAPSGAAPGRPHVVLATLNATPPGKSECQDARCIDVD